MRIPFDGGGTGTQEGGVGGVRDPVLDEVTWGRPPPPVELESTSYGGSGGSVEVDDRLTAPVDELTSPSSGPVLDSTVGSSVVDESAAGALVSPVVPSSNGAVLLLLRPSPSGSVAQHMHGRGRECDSESVAIHACAKARGGAPAGWPESSVEASWDLCAHLRRRSPADRTLAECMRIEGCSSMRGGAERSIDS
jgi:hypothetical protein